MVVLVLLLVVVVVVVVVLAQCGRGPTSMLEGEQISIVASPSQPDAHQTWHSSLVTAPVQLCSNCGLSRGMPSRQSSGSHFGSRPCKETPPEAFSAQCQRCAPACDEKPSAQVAQHSSPKLMVSQVSTTLASGRAEHMSARHSSDWPARVPLLRQMKFSGVPA